MQHAVCGAAGSCVAPKRGEIKRPIVVFNAGSRLHLTVMHRGRALATKQQSACISLLLGMPAFSGSANAKWPIIRLGKYPFLTHSLVYSPHIQWSAQRLMCFCPLVHSVVLFACMSPAMTFRASLRGCYASGIAVATLLTDWLIVEPRATHVLMERYAFENALARDQERGQFRTSSSADCMDFLRP